MSTDRTLTMAYADPPYPGQAKRLYGAHPDYAGEVDHRELIRRLERDFDGWALSTGSKMLPDVLALCPRPIRVLAWTKPMAPPLGDGFMYGWEPVLLRGGRKPESPVRDWISVSPDGDTFRARPEGDVIGAKPRAFCFWLFEAMGLRPNDRLDDLFPGSGAVSAAWDAWRAQGRLRPRGELVEVPMVLLHHLGIALAKARYSGRGESE